MLELEQNFNSLSEHVKRLEQEKELLQKHIRTQEYTHSTEVVALQEEQGILVKNLKEQVRLTYIHMYICTYPHNICAYVY